MPTIDADAHVVESPETWSYIDEAYKKYTPTVVSRTEGGEVTGIRGQTVQEFWVVDGRLMNKQFNVGTDTTADTREMRDIGARLAHMDEIGVDVQVLYPTLFLRPVTMNPDAEFALCHAYNRWLAGIWKQAPDRLRWVVAPPVMSMDKVADELAFAKDNGAVGVFLRGLECDRMMSDPFLFPLYEAASRLDLAICPHSATNSFTMYNQFHDDPGFYKFKLATIGGCHALLWHGIPARFPDLRWGFVEVSAQWIPYVLNDLSLRLKRRGEEMPKDVLARNNIYVACQITDDLPYILDYAGEDTLLIGTDFGHADTATEIEALRMLKQDDRIPAGAVDKILDDNPRRFYGL